MKPVHLILLGSLLASLGAFAGELKLRSDYLIMYKEAAAHFKTIGIDVKPGIYLHNRSQTIGREDLKDISSGGSWKVPLIGKEIYLGYASGQVPKTRNEVWAIFDGKFFLVKDQKGATQQINNGVPLEIVPAREGMYLVTASKKVIFRYHEADRNKTLKSQNPYNLYSLHPHSYQLSRDGHNMLFLTEDLKLVRHGNDGKNQVIVPSFEEHPKLGPKMSFTGDGIFLPTATGIEFLKLDGTGKVESKSQILTLRSDERVVFYENIPILIQNLAVGGKRKYILGDDGSLLPLDAGKNLYGTKLKSLEINLLMSYAEDWGSRARLGHFDSIFIRDAYIERALSLLKGQTMTWVNMSGPYGVGKSSLLKSVTKYIVRQQEKGSVEWEEFEIFHFPLSSVIAAKTASDQICPKGVCKNGGTPPWIKVQNALFGRKVLILMDDFLDDPGLGPTNINKAMDAFLGFFRKEIKDGKLRIITTADDILWRDINVANPQVKNMGYNVTVTSPPPEELDAMLSAAMRSLEGKFKVSFGEGVKGIILDSARELFPIDVEPNRSIRSAEILARTHGSINSKGITQIGVLEVRKHFLSYVFDATKLEEMDTVALRAMLDREVVGHEEVKDEIVNKFISLKLGIISMDEPIAKFLFTGPTGVGKTYTAELLAKQIGVPMIKIDMSYFTGFDPDSVITQMVKNQKGKPYVLLLDDVDKSAVKLAELRGLIERGIYAEGTDNELSFRNAIIIMTGNYGAKLISEASSLSIKEILPLLREYVLSGETPANEKIPLHVWARLQESTLIFKALTEDQLTLVSKKFVKEISRDFMLRENIKIMVGDNYLEYVVSTSLDSSLGASPIREKIVGDLKRKIAEHLFAIKEADKTKAIMLKIFPRVRKVYIDQAPSGRLVIVNNTQAGFPVK